MNRLIENPNTSSDIEIVEQINEQQEYKKLADYTRKIDGGVIFSYNRATKKIAKAKFRTGETYYLGGENNVSLDIEKGCTYIEALNERNALKKLAKGDVIFKA